MSKLLANPYARLAGRALLAGLVTALTQIQTSSDATVAWKAAVVAGALAAAEAFTPLNAIVGVFKKPAAPAPVPSPPPTK